MSDSIEKIPLAHEAPAPDISDSPTAPMPEQPSPNRLGLAIEAAEIANIKDIHVREVAAKVFAQELYQVPDWKNILKSAESMKANISLPVNTCGRPLPNKENEVLAISVVQVGKIEDPKISAVVATGILKALDTKRTWGLTDPAQKLEATEFEKRIMELGKCNLKK